MKNNTNGVLARNLRKLMEASEINSQLKLAAAAGVAQTNISNILRGTVSPTLDTVEKIAAAYNLQPYQLIWPHFIEIMIRREWRGTKQEH